MEWLTTIKEALNYIEENIESIKSIDEIAKNLYVSTLYLQQGFQVMTGYSLGEYLRNRRLFLAAQDLLKYDAKITDIAFKYSYETVESFSRAFTRFHGFTPSKIKENSRNIHEFHPLMIDIVVRGGSMKELEFKIVKMFPFKVVGFSKDFSFENSYEEIPKFWDEICEKYFNNVWDGNNPKNPVEKAVIDYSIGEYGVCIDSEETRFKYMIAGKYIGGEIPKGLELYEFPALSWAVFDSIGECPEALQSLNTRIFKEWLPGNKEYELSGNANIEWYDPMNSNTKDPKYHTQIWIPVRKIK